jgi:membrane associated rhomboid family serine protease
MIPLRDEIRTRRRPYLVYVIIGINVAVWLFELLLFLGSSDRFVDFIYTFGDSTFAKGSGGELVWRYIELFCY